MGLKFRRGTTAQKSGSLAFGEPYVNTTLGTLQIGGETGDITLGASGTGSQGSFAGISGSSLDITGNAKIDGNLTLGGAITIGDASADTVNVIASLSSSLIPQTTNAFDLGSASKIWRDLYISTGSIKVVAGGSVLASISTNSDGSQTFPNGLYSQANIQIGDGSYLNAGKFQVGRRGDSPDQNVVLGIDIMPSLTSGVGNVGLGRASLYRLTTGQSNIAVGDQAGYGISGSNSQNIAIGYGTAFYMTGSNVGQNVFLGHNAGSYLNNGIYNTAIGGNALLGSLNGSNTPTKSTALGYGAGTYLVGNSTNNLLLGANAGPSSDTTESYKLYVSNGDYQSQPFMNGNMANDSRTLSINAATTISGSVTGTSFNGTINANNGVLSGSLQAQLPAGVVSGSSQVTLSSTTGGGTSDNVRFGSLGIGMAASGTAGRIDASGDVVAFSTSDKNFKENITPIENAIEKIRMISGNTYDWKSDMKEFHGFEGNDVGVIAQEIEAVLPQLVTTRETGYKAVKYDKLVALLIEGIKEQQQNIDNLTIQVEELKKAKGL